MIVMDKKILNAYIELCKPRILSLILVTTTLGFYLGGHGIRNWVVFLSTILGAGLTCSGAAALNHYLERDVDKLMRRTHNRPIPRGLIYPAQALIFGIVLILS